MAEFFDFIRDVAVLILGIGMMGFGLFGAFVVFIAPGFASSGGSHSKGDWYLILILVCVALVGAGIAFG